MLNSHHIKNSKVLAHHTTPQVKFTSHIFLKKKFNPSKDMLHNLSTYQKKRLIETEKKEIGYENESKALKHQIPKLKPRERKRESRVWRLLVNN
jgi:hypothetical protein